MLKPGALTGFECVWLSVGTAHGDYGLLCFCCFVSKLYFTHTKITVARVFFYFLDIIKVTVGSLVDGTEITQLI